MFSGKIAVIVIGFALWHSWRLFAILPLKSPCKHPIFNHDVHRFSALRDMTSAAAEIGINPLSRTGTLPLVGLFW